MNQPVRVSHRFAVPAECVFDAWLDPFWISRWMSGPGVREERVVWPGANLRVGGKFPIIINRNGTDIAQVGEYLEIDRPHLLVFRWSARASVPDASRVIVEIFPCDSGCDLTLTHVTGADWTAFADKADSSWRQILAAMESALAKTNSLVLNPNST